MVKRMAGVSLAVMMAFAQKPPAFDAASVKPNTSGTGGFGMETSHGRLTATNVPVRMLILKGFHTKEFQVTGGPKLKPHVGDDEPKISGRTGSGKASFVCTKISMAGLADMLGDYTDRIVVDNTGLKGVYDFKLDWTQEDSHEPAGISMLSSLQEGLGLTGPSLFTAVQEQLGLKLAPAKGPVQIIVIDGAEKAREN